MVGGRVCGKRCQSSRCFQRELFDVSDPCHAVRLGEEDPDVADLRTIAVQAGHNVPQHPFKPFSPTLHLPWERQGKPRRPVKFKGGAGQLHLSTLRDWWKSGVKSFCHLLPHPDPGQPTTDSTLNYQCCFSPGFLRLKGFHLKMFKVTTKSFRVLTENQDMGLLACLSSLAAFVFSRNSLRPPSPYPPPPPLPPPILESLPCLVRRSVYNSRAPLPLPSCLP